MGSGYFNIFNFNAFRCRNIGKIRNYYDFFEQYSPAFVFIQEINISSALTIFGDKFQVFINVESDAQDGIGIVTLVRKGLYVSDIIVGKNGRIIGVKVCNLQLWNVYPKSGSGYKNERETFFREDLCNLMMNWKDTTEFILQSGDHNCIHRLKDSENNAGQHLQPGLIKHMQINGLSDDFINVHGTDVIMYSRITAISKTRIDYVLSNSKKCEYFQYISMVGLDHKAIFARYEIEIQYKKENIPRDRYISNWVISKKLENDQDFQDSCRIACDKMKEEYDCDHDRDPSFIWLKLKTALIGVAKTREKELRDLEYEKYKILKGYYNSILSDIVNGINCYEELEKVKAEMDNHYKRVSNEKINKMRCLEIDDSVYDIHKLQNQRKYEGQKKISEIVIGDRLESGTANVIKCIEDKMRSELESFDTLDINDLATNHELEFLEKIKKVDWTEEEINELVSPIKENEISQILKNEVDLDSSPGEDGITYRFIALFWNWPAYRYLYIHFLNYTRECGHWGLIENCGIMTIKNKKNFSNKYEKKRKLTKVNKESNLGNGKVWTNRLKVLFFREFFQKINLTVSLI